MINHDHFDDIKRRMTAYWKRDETDRCCAAIRVKKKGYTDDGDKHFYFDVEAADRYYRQRFSNFSYFGEAYPCLFPYFGTAGIAEYTGCEPERTDKTTWFEPWLDRPTAENIGYNKPEAFIKQREAVERLVALSKGDYLVSVTDNAGVLDALAEIRGTDNLLMDLACDPEFVEEAVQKLLPIYKQTQKELFDAVEENNQGTTLAWMQLWAPKRMAQLQCDLSVMISPTMFENFAMPELEELCEFLDYPVYHLDGQEQVRHLDHLLSLDKLKAIQWTAVVAQPDTSNFIPVLQRIQKAGKSLILHPHPYEVKTLLDNLSCRGLHLVIDQLESEQDARDMMMLIEKHSKNRW